MTAEGSASARDVALAALGRVDDGAYANLALPALLARSGLGVADRAAVTDLVYGSLRLRGALDHALRPLSRQPLEQLEPLVLRGLRLGAYELLFGGTAAHAAVAETVAAVTRAGRRGQAGYVNAVLRRLATTPPQWPDPAADPAGWATTRGSHPAWVVDEALARLGPDGLVALVEADNTRPQVTLRATPGRATRDGLLAELAAAGVPARPHPLGAGCLVLERGDPAGLAAVRDGRAVVQDAASALVAPAVGAAPGDLVVDLAAGPGGKAGHLAALGARVLAVERHPGRARMVRETARRLGVAGRLHAVVGDGRCPPLRAGGADAALVDAPCSNLGSLRRRPEARWRHRPEEVAGLVALQLDLLLAAADAVRPGGTVVYSVCTWTRAETDGVVDELLRRRPDLAPDPSGARPIGGPPWGPPDPPGPWDPADRGTPPGSPGPPRSDRGTPPGSPGPPRSDRGTPRSSGAPLRGSPDPSGGSPGPPRPDPSVSAGGRRQLWPHRDDADGVYLARLVKTAQPRGSR